MNYFDKRRKELGLEDAEPETAQDDYFAKRRAELGIGQTNPQDDQSGGFIDTALSLPGIAYEGAKQGLKTGADMTIGGIQAIQDAPLAKAFPLGGDILFSDTAKRIVDYTDDATKDLRTPDATPEYAEFTNLKTPEDYAKWAAYSLGQGLGSSAPILAGGAVTGGAGAFVPAYVMAVGDVHKTILEEAPDIDPNKAIALALAGAAPYAAMDQIVPGKAGEKATKRVVVDALLDQARKKGIISAGAKVGKEVLKDSATEGLTEGLQGVVTDATAGIAAEDDPAKMFERIKNNLPKYINEGMAGAVGGGGMSVGGQVASKIQSKISDNKNQNIDAPEGNETDRSDVMGEGDTLPVTSQEDLGDDAQDTAPKRIADSAELTKLVNEAYAKGDNEAAQALLDANPVDDPKIKAHQQARDEVDRIVGPRPQVQDTDPVLDANKRKAEAEAREAEARAKIAETQAEQVTGQPTQMPEVDEGDQAKISGPQTPQSEPQPDLQTTDGPQTQEQPKQPVEMPQAPTQKVDLSGKEYETLDQFLRDNPIGLQSGDVRQSDVLKGDRRRLTSGSKPLISNKGDGRAPDELYTQLEEMGLAAKFGINSGDELLSALGNPDKLKEVAEPSDNEYVKMMEEEARRRGYDPNEEAPTDQVTEQDTEQEDYSKYDDELEGADVDPEDDLSDIRFAQKRTPADDRKIGTVLRLQSREVSGEPNQLIQVQPETASDRFLVALAGRLGRKIVFYKSRNGESAMPGFADPAAPDVVYIAKDVYDSHTQVQAVLLHELLHSLRNTDKNLYNKLIQKIRAKSKKALDEGKKGYISDSIKGGQLDYIEDVVNKPDVLEEEGAAYMLEGGFLDMDMLRDADPTFYGKLKRAVRNLLAKVRGQKQNPMREEAIDALRGYLEIIDEAEAQTIEENRVIEPVSNAPVATTPNDDEGDDVEEDGEGEVRRAIARSMLPESSMDISEGPQGVSITPTKSKYQEAINTLNEIQKRFPNPLQSEDTWEEFATRVRGAKTFLMHPHKAIEIVKNPIKWYREERKGYHTNALSQAKHGIDAAKKTRKNWLNGSIKKKDGIRTLALQTMWNMLSRKTSPYVQESLFMVALRGDILTHIDKAIAGNFVIGDRQNRKMMKGKPTEVPVGPAVKTPNGDTYFEWVDKTIDTVSDSPGNPATFSLNDFGRITLQKMSEKGRFIPNKTGWDMFYEWMTNPDMTGQQFRRNFWEMIGQDNVGFDNKILSFLLLGAGFPDVIIIDRVAAKYHWDGENRFEEYGSESAEIYDGLNMADAFVGVQGLAYYEAIEDGLAEALNNEYINDEGSFYGPAQIHWELWNANSSQDADHRTLEAIDRVANGLSTKDAVIGIGAREGKYNRYYGTEYLAMDDGFYFVQTTTDGRKFAFDSKEQYDELYAKHITTAKGGVFPSNQKPTLLKATKPFTEQEGFNAQAYDNLVEQGQDITADYYNSTGTPIPKHLNQTLNSSKNKGTSRHAQKRDGVPFSVTELEDQLSSKYGLENLSLYDRGNDIVLNMIAVPKEKQKQGIGTKVMEELVSFADESGKRILLSPGLKDSNFGTTSRSRLVKFYKRFGFVENKGRNKDFQISEGMYREPQSTRYAQKRDREENRTTIRNDGLTFRPKDIDKEDAIRIAKGMGWDEDFVDEEELAKELPEMLVLSANPSWDDLTDGEIDQINSIYWETEGETESNTSFIDYSAVRELPETDVWQLAGFITPEGKLLDMSEGQGERTLDHRHVAKDGFNGLVEFQNQGNIRIDSSGMIDLMVKPTPEQERVIAEIVDDLYGEVYLELGDGLSEFDKERGQYKGGNGSNRPWSGNYPEGTTPERIINDIKKYFRGGTPKVPDARYAQKRNPQTETQAFKDPDIRYSFKRDLAPTTYSALTNSISEKMPNAMPIADLKNLIKKLPGIKEEELEFTGLDKWIDAQDGKVSKEDVLQFLEENQVNVEVVEKGGSRLPEISAEAKREKIIQDIRDSFYDVNDEQWRDWLWDWRMEKAREIWEDENHFAWKNINGTKAEFIEEYGDDDVENQDGFLEEIYNLPRYTDYISPEDVESKFQEELEQLSDRITERMEDPNDPVNDPDFNPDDTKYHNYTLPGAKEGTYCEMLLTLPITAPKTDRVRVEKQENGYSVAEYSPNGTFSGYLGVYDTEAEAEQKRAIHERKYINNEDVPLYRSSHFDEPNILAHLRFNERVSADGKRTMFLEEIQSDWHQAGRKKGYGPRTETVFYIRYKDGGRLGSSFSTKELAEEAAQDVLGDRGFEIEEVTEEKPSSRTIPNAPFKTSWPELALKHALRYAAENDLEQIAWTTGQQQVKRYEDATRKAVDKIEILPTFSTGGIAYQVTGYKNGGQVIDQESSADDLDSLVGKEIADKAITELEPQVNDLNNGITDPDQRTAPRKPAIFEGDDLTIGGEGMKGFYNKMLPNIAKKLVKKLDKQHPGVKVVEVGVKDFSWKDDGASHYSSDGRWVIETGAGGARDQVELWDKNDTVGLFDTIEEAKSYVEDEVGGLRTQQLAIDITPTLKDKVLYEGQARFAQKREARRGVAFHGSPHNFDRFDVSKVGSGEGAAMFGKGLYFASKQEVAQAYKEKFAKWNNPDRYENAVETEEVQEAREKLVWILEDVDYLGFDYAGQAIGAIKNDPDWAKKWDAEGYEDEINKALATYQEALKEAGAFDSAYGYEVNLAPEEDEYLLWDKPLSEQSEKVKEAIKKIPQSYISQMPQGIIKVALTKPDGPGAWSHATGQQLYYALYDQAARGERLTPNSQKAEVDALTDASDILLSVGIRGNKYLDGGSRDDGDGTYNYVIFDDKDVEITGRFAQKREARTLPKSLEASGRNPGTDLEYEPVSNQGDIDSAKERILTRGPKNATDDILKIDDEKKFTSKDFTTSLLLIDQWQQEAEVARSEGDEQAEEYAMNRVLDLSSHAAQKLTEAGQLVQSASIISRLDPGAVVLEAQRRINKMNEKLGENEAPKVLDAKEAMRLREMAENAQKWGYLTKQAKRVAEITSKMNTRTPLNQNDKKALLDFVTSTKRVLNGSFPQGMPEPRTKPKAEAKEKAPKVKDVELTGWKALVAEKSKSKADAARERLKKRGIVLRAGIPVDVMADLTIVGLDKAIQTGLKFTEWSESMVSEFGDDIKDHLKDIYAKVQREYSVEEKRAKKVTANLAKFEAYLDKLADEMVGDYYLGNEADAEALGLAIEYVKSTTGDAQVEAAQEVQQALNMLKTPTLGDKISTGQVISHLLNTKTNVRNILGNEAYYRLERLNKYVATGIDYTRSSLTGSDRTVTFSKGGQSGYWEGLMKGARLGWKGIQPGDLTTQFDLNPTGPVFRDKRNPLYWMERTLGATLRGFDYAAYTRAKRNTLGELAELAYMNSKATGDKETFIKEFIERADAEANDIAHEYGKYVTFQEDSALADAFTGVKQTLNYLGTGGEVKGSKRHGGFGLGDLVLKYAKTPANLIQTALDYSPVGVMRSMFMMKDVIVKGKGTPREVTEALSRGLVGSFGTSLMGAMLYDLGILTGDDDDWGKDAFLREQGGMSSFQVNISALTRYLTSFDRRLAKPRKGDVMYSYDWLQPMAINAAIGASVMKSVNRSQGVGEGALSMYETGIKSLGAGVNTIMGQPLLQGLMELVPSSFKSDDDEAKWTSGLQRVAEGVPSQMIPSFVNHIRSIADNTRRVTSSPKAHERAFNRMVDRIPFLAETLPEAYKTFGVDEKSVKYEDSNIAVDAFNVLLNPGFVREYGVKPEAAHILDIYEESGNDKVLQDRGTTTIRVGKADMRRIRNPRTGKMMDIEGVSQTVKLTGKDRSMLQALMGRYSFEEFKRIENSLSRYDANKQAEMVASAMNKGYDRAKKEFINKRLASYFE